MKNKAERFILGFIINQEGGGLVIKSNMNGYIHRIDNPLDLSLSDIETYNLDIDNIQTEFMGCVNGYNKTYKQFCQFQPKYVGFFEHLIELEKQ